MILTPYINTSLQAPSLNPTVTLIEREKSNKLLHYPDPNTYYMVSGIYDLFNITNVNSILVGSIFNSERRFTISHTSENIISLSKTMFSGTKPLDGIALAAFEETIIRIGKDKPTRRNRL